MVGSSYSTSDTRHEQTCHSPNTTQCNGNAAQHKVIRTVLGSLPPLLTVLVEISFSSVGGEAVYNERGQGSNPIKDIVFFGDKICSTVCYNIKLKS